MVTVEPSNSCALFKLTQIVRHTSGESNISHDANLFKAI